MKKFFSAFIFFFMFHNQNTSAHEGGHGPVSEQQAIIIASNLAGQFVEHDPGLGFGTLSGSWVQLPLSDKRIHKKGDGYYIVGLTNIKEEKSLFILMSISGEVYDANFTGNFPGLK